MHIRVGEKFQAELPNLISNKLRKSVTNKETLVWTPSTNKLNGTQLNSYLNKIVEKKLSTNTAQTDTLNSRDNIMVSFKSQTTNLK